MKKDLLGDRMKTYESASRHYLTRRTPVIIRLDGCHFHTFTKDFNKPYDEILCRSMQETMLHLCKNIQGCVLGYTQSDEITLVLCDYKKLETQAWFDNGIQKMCSVSASMATIMFNQVFSYLADKDGRYPYYYAKVKGATFDSRAFNLPREEVTNCLIWRQLDAVRNSIQGLGQAYYSHKELLGKSCQDIKEMLKTELQIDWNTEVLRKFQVGSCCVKTDEGWVIDNEIPDFRQDREYVESRITFEDT